MKPQRGSFHPTNGCLNVKKESTHFLSNLSPEKQGLDCYAAECGTFTRRKAHLSLLKDTPKIVKIKIFILLLYLIDLTC
jgi:hypothetical protein